MPPRFSLLMSTRDRPQYIEGAIGAVLAQDFTDWELLVADSGKCPVRGLIPDDPRIQYIQHGEVFGFNAALRAARGEIVGFASDDDVMLPGALSHVNQTIGDAMWLYGQIRFCPDGKPAWQFMGEPWDYERLKHIDIVPAPATFFRRSVVAIVGEFDLSLIPSDYDYWLRLGARWEPIYTERVLVNYRVHKDSATVTLTKEMGQQSKRISERALNGYYAPATVAKDTP